METTPGPKNAPFDVQQLLDLKRVTDVVAAPCGTWAAVAVERLNHDASQYVMDLWKVALDGSSQAWQLTRGKSRDHAPRFMADGTLLFLSNRSDSDSTPNGDADADQRAQIWSLPAHGGEPVRLTDEPLGISAFRCARTSDTLAWLTPVWPGVAHADQREHERKRGKNGPSALHYKTMPMRYWDAWLSNTRSHLIVQDANGRRDLTPNAQRELEQASFDLSPNGQQLAITWRNEGSDRVEEAGLMVFDLSRDLSCDLSHNAQRLLGHQPLAVLLTPLFSPDSSRILCQIDQRFEHACPTTGLRIIDVASGKSTPLAPAWNCWPTPQAWQADGNSVFATAHDQGCTPIFQIELATGDIVRLTEEGSHGKINFIQGADESTKHSIVALKSSLLSPPEVLHSPLHSGMQCLPCAQLSGFDPGCINVSIENQSAISSDQHPVQYWLIRPAQSPQPAPVLLWIHGGPMGAWQDEWHWRWNAMLAVAQGYALLLPNPRGSTGFGQTFTAGVWGNTWGQQCYEDILAVLDHIAPRTDLNVQRIAAMGGSFGGYMANWLGTQTTRFKCLISHAGIYSMSAMTGVTDLPAFWYLEMDGEPYSDPTWFDRYSPSRGISKWRTPTLIIHGERDYRVPISEALALFEALQYHHVESELLVFPDENHWICKPNNILVWYQSVFEFLQRHI